MFRLVTDEETYEQGTWKDVEPCKNIKRGKLT